MRFPVLFLFAVSILSLTGCGLFSSSDEVEPAKLQKFDKKITIKKRWSKGIGSQGKEELYMRLLPAIDGGVIYAADVKGKVIALNRNNGKKLWAVNTKEKLTSAVGAGEHVVTVGSINGELLALNQADGQELWRVQLSSEMLAAAQVGSGVVVAQAIDGRVLGLDKNSGNILWRYQASLPTLTLRGSATPAIAGGVTYLGFASGKVVALDIHTGLLIWEQQASIAEGRTELERLIDFDGQPLVVGSDMYIAGYQGQAAALERTQGRFLWMEEISTADGLAYGSGNIYVSESNDHVMALKMATGRKFWENEEYLLRQLSAPAVIGDYVAVADYEGYVHFLSQDDGITVGRYRVGGKGVRNAMLSDGKTLYVLNNRGTLSALYIKPK